jgi:hypothetical protein
MISFKRGREMMARYLVVFFIGWAFNFALDANIVGATHGKRK